MPETIELTDVRITLADYNTMSGVLINRLVFTRNRLLLMGVALLMVLITAARELWRYYHHELEDFPVWPVALLGGLLFFAFRIKGKLLKAFQNQFEKSPYTQQANDFHLDAAGLRVENPLSRASYDWAAFQRAMHIGPWVLLFINDFSAFYLDTRCLVQPATPADLLSLLQSKNIKLE
jgi:hypothetical protein